MPTDKIGSGPACDGTKVFIEVTGVQHDPSYGFQFYDAKDDSRKTDIEGKKVCQPLGDTSIYSWEWKKNSPPINACLSIASDNGDITLPLYDDAQAKERVDGEQDYLLHSIVPLTLLPTYNENLQENERYAPTRNGYFYVFYNNKAWREIEMRSPDAGPVVFRDVDLSAYRTGENDTFSSDKRESVGKPLKEIWLPVKNNQQDTVVHLAYSDVPWSGERLNYLEANVSELKNRAQSLHAIKGMKNSPKNRAKEALVLPATMLPEMRVREPEFEWFVAEPLQFNRDLTGDWLSRQYQDVKKAIADSNDGSKISNVEYRSAFQYEYGMKQAALKSLINEDDSIDKDWEASASIDFLEDAKDRHLRTLVLDDPLFDLTHSAFICMSGVGYMQQVYVDMSNQEYYQSAELIQQLIVPAKFGKQENPLHKYKEDLHSTSTGRFQRTLRSIERQIANRDVRELQQVVNQRLNNERTATVLRDISSLNTKKAAATYSVTGCAISALCIDIDSIDTFAKYDFYIKKYNTKRGTRTRKVTHVDSKSHMKQTRTTLEKILTSEKHPLHKVLFVPEGDVPLDKEYVASEAFNDGSGFATAQSLAQWNIDDFLDDNQDDDAKHDDIDLQSIVKLNTAFDTEAIATGAFAQVRRASNIMDSIFKGFFEALMALKDLESNAKVISFNKAYASVLRLAKATNAKQLSKMTFTSVSGVETSFHVLGVHTGELSFGLSADDKDYIKNKTRKGLQGSIKDVDGTLVAASNKKTFNNVDKAHLGERAPLKVVALPAGSEVGKSYNQANTQRALRNLEKQGLNSSNAYQKIKIPYWITVIETVNLLVNFKYAQSLYDGKDAIYSFASITSAVTDLGIAITHSVSFYSEQASRSARSFVPKNTSVTGRATGKQGVRFVASRAFGVLAIGAGVLTAVLACWDGIRLFSENDKDAAMGMFMVAAGTLTTTFSGFAASTPILFGLGPIAWIGIGLAIAGTIAYFYFLDTPIEKWLKNGPFAEDPADKYAHLQDNKVAFERLISCLFSVDIKAYKYGDQTAFPARFNAEMKAKGVTHAIQVKSNLASLLNQDDIRLEFFARSAIQETRTSISYYSGSTTMASVRIRPQGQKKVSVIAIQPDFGGYTVFVKDDLTLPKEELSTFYAKAFVVRARLSMDDSVFPSLPLDEKDGAVKPSETPKFTEDEKFWVNQNVTVGVQNKP